MCYCCCTTRKGILIYMMVVSIIAFIYGIVAISYFGSSTDIYKYFKDKLDNLDKSSSSSSSSTRHLYTPTYNSQTEKWAKAILDTISKEKIDNIDSTNSYSTSVIGNLKGIENGLGVVLFIFPIIFLIFEIVFLVFSCGNKEFTPLPETTYKVLYVIKTICQTFSVIFIFLSILYGILLIIALSQYFSIVENTDSCVIGIIVGMVYGYYGFWYYITISVGFSKEKELARLVGTVDNPGTGAKFDVNGNPIVPVVQAVVQPVQPTTYSNLQQINNGVIPMNQTQSAYQTLSLNSKDDDLIFYNGMIYKKVGNAKNITSVEVSNIPNAVNSDKPNAGENVEVSAK